MRRPIKVILAGLLLIACLLSGCFTPVLVDYDHKAVSKFASYRCFVIDAPAAQEHSNDLALSPIVSRRFASELAESLKLRGYVENCPSPDFRVRFNLSKQTVNNIDFNYPNNLRFFYYNNVYPDVGFFPQPYFDQYEEGTFLIDLIDATSEELVWRGTYTERLGRHALKENKIRTIIDRILDQFPPTKNEYFN